MSKRINTEKYPLLPGIGESDEGWPDAHPISGGFTYGDKQSKLVFDEPIAVLEIKKPDEPEEAKWGPGGSFQIIIVKCSNN